MRVPPVGSPTSIATQNARYASIRDIDVMIARQIPDDPYRSKIKFASQIKNIVDELMWFIVGVFLGMGLAFTGQASPDWGVVVFQQ